MCIVEVKVPRDRNEGYEPRIIGKYSRNAGKWKRRFWGYMPAGELWTVHINRVVL